MKDPNLNRLLRGLDLDDIHSGPKRVPAVPQSVNTIANLDLEARHDKKKLDSNLKHSEEPTSFQKTTPFSNPNKLKPMTGILFKNILTSIICQSV